MIQYNPSPKAGMQNSPRAVWKAGNQGWFQDFADWPDVGREEARKRRLYVLLSLPGIVFFFIWGGYNIISDNYVGGALDISAAVTLFVGIFYLRRASRALWIYRINTLILMGVMLYWCANGGSDGEKTIWGFTFPLIACFMLGPVEGTIWNGVALGLVCLVFFADLPFPVYHYSWALKIRYICVYLVISLLTYIYEFFRKESWDIFFRYEKEKKELQEKLARSQKMEALGLLAGGVAHDLNNVMFGLVSYPDYLLSKLETHDPMHAPLKSICESGRKAAAIVDELLTLARRGVTNTRTLDLNSLVKEYFDSPEYKKLEELNARVEIVSWLSQDLKIVKGSALHLKKCIMNLVSNAVEALPEGGRVIVSTANCYVGQPIKGYSDVARGEYVLLQVEDNGIGIPSEDLPHIFEPFYTKKIMGRSGTGLGMAVVWGSVQDHQGYIDVQSQQGQGTAISVYLPVSDEPLAEDLPDIPTQDYTGKGETILIVDDTQDQRIIAGRMLKELGYKVHSVASGEAAVEIIKRQPMDLILLDMIMGAGMDGLETYRRILQIHPTQKAIFVSGFPETNHVRAARELGAKAYVKKPFVLEELGVVIRTALEA